MDVFLEGLQLQRNQNPFGIGGAISISGADNVRIIDCEFAKNVGAHAGGLYVRQTKGLSLKQCKFIANKAAKPRMDGGEEKLDAVASSGLDDYPRLGGGMLLSEVGNAIIVGTTWQLNKVSSWADVQGRLPAQNTLAYTSNEQCAACQVIQSCFCSLIRVLGGLEDAGPDSHEVLSFRRSYSFQYS